MSSSDTVLTLSINSHGATLEVVNETPQTKLTTGQMAEVLFQLTIEADRIIREVAEPKKGRHE